MTDAWDLLARGYFPKELPPPFSTEDFANRVIGSIDPIPTYISGGRRSRLCTHNYARIGRLRRVLGIPNPIPQYRLALLVQGSWARLEKLIQKSTIGVSQPTPSADRALLPGAKPLNELRARIRAPARLLVTADISRFYHSIYTHTITWAIHGKAQSKSRVGKKGGRLLGSKLDAAVADCQDGQTVGVPVGPDTSLVLAELIASAVDVKLQKEVRNLLGLRFMDDYEFPCKTRLEADELLQSLHMALSKFELALNPLKTHVAELPLPIDQPWKTPIRTATIRLTAKEQATDLIALFDVAYSLSRQFPDKSVLTYAIGRLADVNIRSENVELSQRLCMQCMLSEPGASSIVLERLAAYRAKGLPLNLAELESILNDQIVEHAPLNHGNEVAWAVWGALIFDLPVDKKAAKALSSVEDSVVALLALHSRERGLMHAALDTSLWQSHLAAEQLFGEHWLLAYEASIKGWLTSPAGIDHIGAEAAFTWLRRSGVEFYDRGKADPVPVAPAEPEPNWLSDLKERRDARRSYYGEPEEADPDFPDLI